MLKKKIIYDEYYEKIQYSDKFSENGNFILVQLQNKTSLKQSITF